MTRAALLPVAAVVLAACGGGLTANKKSVLSPRPTPPITPAVVSAVAPTSAPTQSFKVALTAAAPSRATGSATIRIYRKQGEICWTFSKLIGVGHPAGGAVDLNTASRQTLLAFGNGYTPSGCISHGPQVPFALAEIPPVTTGAAANILGDFLVVVNVTHGTAIVPRLSGVL